MKAKIFTTTSFAILSLLLLTSFVVAVVGVAVSPSTLRFSALDLVKSITITNGEDVADITLTTPASISDGTNTLSFSLSSNEFLAVPASDQRTVTVTLNGNPQDLEFGEYTTSFDVTATNAASNTDKKTVSLITRSSFCSNGPRGGNLSIKDVDVTNRGEGDDDEWERLDIIEVDVEIENNGNEEIEDVIVELSIFDSDGNNIADDMDFINPDGEEIELGDINDDDEETDKFEFRIEPDISTGNYKLAVKAYSDDLGESVECVDFSSALGNNFFDSISIDAPEDEDKFVVVDDVLFDSAQYTCGDPVTGSFGVFNIGDDDQERVLITMKNTELSVDQEFEITSDLNEGDDDDVQFSFRIPNNALDKSYTLEFKTFYDYNRGVYREVSQDTFVGFLEVIGCGLTNGGTTTGKAIITASLGSEAKAGADLVVNSLITNTGSEKATFIIDTTGFSSWASLNSISKKVLDLDSGESQEVEFSFKVNENTTGPQTFTIEAASNGNVDTRQVEVNIAGAGSGVTGFAGFELGSGNLIWIIVIVNIILIILIILVAVRLSRQ